MKWFALLALIVAFAVGCSGSSTQKPEVTGTIAFTRGDAVWLMRADGGGQRRLTRGFGPAWSPGGGKIAFSMRGNNESSPIYVIDPDGRSRVKLTTPEFRYDAHYSPVWSPDGKIIAFQGYDDGAYWLSVVRADGSGQRTITLTRSLEDAGPVWSRDGRTIMFTNVHDNAVYAMRPDGGGRRVLARIDGEDRIWGVEWSPDRRRFTALIDADLWLMSAEGTRLRMLYDNTVDKPGRVGGITWAPDGRAIAFSAEEGRGLEADGEIYVVDSDGSRLRKLTDNDGVLDEGPAWSPDGRAIAFTSDRDGNPEIYVMDVDGSNQRNLSQSPMDDLSPAWSPED